jgi:hypothetical protein
MKAITDNEGLTIVSIDHEYKDTYTITIAKACATEQVAWLLNQLGKDLGNNSIDDNLMSIFDLINLQRKKKGLPKMQLVEVLRDIPFEEFWDEYGYKKGDKARVKRIWDAMKAEEKTKALLYIKKYKFFLAQNPTIQPRFPQTYLNSAEWNNETK